MPSNKLCRTAALLVILSLGAHAQGAPAPGTHCQAGESVRFSCRIGSKTVSLCAGDKVAYLAYRYGLPGKIENEFIARPDNGNLFFGTVSPAAPGASVNQVWFDRGAVRYLLTECTGGNCPQQAGLAVLRGDRLLMNGRCARETGTDLAWFSRELVHFGSDAAGSRSSTDLLRIEDADNELEKIYRFKARDAE